MASSLGRDKADPSLSLTWPRPLNTMVGCLVAVRLSAFSGMTPYMDSSIIGSTAGGVGTRVWSLLMLVSSLRIYRWISYNVTRVGKRFVTTLVWGWNSWEDVASQCLNLEPKSLLQHGCSFFVLPLLIVGWTMSWSRSKAFLFPVESLWNGFFPYVWYVEENCCTARTK